MMFLRSKNIKTLAIIFAFLLLAGTVTILSITLLRKEKIKSIIIAELNSHLNTKVVVKELTFSIFQSFPYASVILNEVKVLPPEKSENIPSLTEGGRIHLKFNILNIITGKYTINSIVVDNAVFTFYEAGDGTNNYSILKTSGNSETGVNFDINKLTIYDSKVSYRNTGRNDDILLAINELQVRGAYQSELFTLKAKGEIISERLLVSGSSIISGGTALIESVIEINTKEKDLDFKKARINLNGVEADFAGIYNYHEKGNIDFIISSLKGNVAVILKVLPSHISEHLTAYRPNGELHLRGSLRGIASSPDKWKISLTGGVLKGSVFYGHKNLLLEGIETSASFYYPGIENAEILTISELKGKIGSGRFKGKGLIRNFSNAKGELTLSLNTSINELDSLTTNKYFTNLKGKLIAELIYKGAFINKTGDEKLSGEVTLTDAAFIYNNKSVSDMNGTVELKDNKLQFHGLECKIGATDLKANGYIDNITGYLLGERKNLHANLNLFSEKLVLEDILDLVPPAETSVQTSIFPPNITFNTVLNVQALSYKKLITEEITGSFSLNQDILRGKDISIAALGGTISAEGIINGRYGNKAQIVTRADFIDVDINLLFYQFNEFGQNSLVSSNLKGKADAHIDFATTLYSDYTINTATVEAIADIEIRQGELNDFEPMQAMSRFLDAKELRNIKFSTLRNRVEIVNKTVVIPRMEINSSALNLIGYGTHTFGNDIDYHVNMLLSDVLRAKRRKNDELEKYVEDDGYGKPRLFLHLTGPVNDPMVRYDTRAVGRKIADDLKKEKQTLKDVIRKEFGGKSSSSGTESKTPVDQSPEFQIEWDENK